MEKSADFIRKKEFHIVFKGYKPEEVDKFLDILSVEFDRLLKRNRELQDSLDKLKFENTEEDTDIKKVIQDALISAHKVAEDIKAQAKKEADSIIENRKAVEDKSLHDLQMKKLEMEESLIVLQGKYDDFKNRIKKNILDMTQFVDEAAMSLDENEYTETNFEDVKFEAAEDNNQDNIDVPVQKIDADESLEDTEDKSENSFQESRLAEKLNEIERTKTDSRQNMSVFDNYNLNTQRDSGSYFERIQRQNLETEREPLKESEFSSKFSDIQIEDVRKGERQTEEGLTEERLKEERPLEETQRTDSDDSILKRERKKIDIANPDIIENFFRTSED